ncbi:MAG: ribosome silencing factor [Alloprevotella sp.]|nr:ribosome silencing factor [Alloprevotella sp.]
MTQTEKLVECIVKGMQEKKAKGVAVADLRKVENAPAQYFVICSGGSPQQAEAISDSVWETVRVEAGEKPAAVQGARSGAQWVAMDYGTVMVHIFLPEAREHYDLENLWEDAPIKRYEDVE